jgi:hypothetical protein
MEEKQCWAIVLEAGVGDADDPVRGVEGEVWHLRGL